MAKFMYVFHGGGIVEPNLSPAELGAHLQKWRTWVGELVAAGRCEPGGGPLQGPGRVVRGKAKAVTDGPYAEAKDLVTGTLIVVAESLDQATELALGCPIYEFDGTVEVRPIAANE